jgi:catechol 2,3-dioxygenase-like lactoylglutathione lyase family enzyme
VHLLDSWQFPRNKFVISTGAKRSGEICGFLSSSYASSAGCNSILATTGEEGHHSGMSQHSGLGKYNIVGFVSIVDVPRAKEFYQNTLGLRLVMEEPPFALVFEANGIMLRLGMAKKLPPAHGTVLGWQVPEIAATVESLGQAGVRFERYEGMNQDELGIWTSPTGAKVAWFKDPDGNILSVSEHPELKK